MVDLNVRILLVKPEFKGVVYFGLHLFSGYFYILLQIIAGGFLFYENRKVSSFGILQASGLYKGVSYWQNGKKKFIGKCNDRMKSGSYYGPSYPVKGKFYNSEGKKVYQGIFICSHQGSIGYPRVDFPSNYGSISW